MPMQNRIVESLRALADGCEDGTDSVCLAETVKLISHELLDSMITTEASGDGVGKANGVALREWCTLMTTLLLSEAQNTRFIGMLLLHATVDRIPSTAESFGSQWCQGLLRDSKADQSEQILSQKIIVSTALLRNMSQSMNLKKEVQEVQLPKLLTPLCVRFERDSKALIDCYKATVLPHLDPLLKTFPASFRSFKSKLESSLIKLFDSTIYGRETYVLCASCLIALSVDRKGNIDSDSMANIVGILMERYQALFGQICTWVEGESEEMHPSEYHQFGNLSTALQKILLTRGMNLPKHFFEMLMPQIRMLKDTLTHLHAASTHPLSRSIFIPDLIKVVISLMICRQYDESDGLNLLSELTIKSMFHRSQNWLLRLQSYNVVHLCCKLFGKRYLSNVSSKIGQAIAQDMITYLDVLETRLQKKDASHLNKLSNIRQVCEAALTVPIKDYSQICRILVLCVINTQKLGLNFAISIEVDRLIYSTLHKFLASVRFDRNTLIIIMRLFGNALRHPNHEIRNISMRSLDVCDLILHPVKPPRHIAEPEVQADLDLPQRAPVSTFVGNPFHERGSKIQTQKSNSTATESVSVDHQDGTSLKPVQVETRSVEKSVVKPKPTDTMLDKSVPVPPKNLSKDVPKEHHPQKHQTEASPEITDEADESEQVAEADEPSPSDDQDGDFVAMSTSRFDPVVQDRMAVDDTTTAQSQSSLPAFRDKGKSTASAKEVKEVMDDDNEEVSFMDMEFAINVDDGPDSEYDSDE